MCFSGRAEQSVSRLPRRSFSWRLFVPISPSISHISMKICVEQSESGSCTGLQGACWRGGEEIWGTVKKKTKKPSPPLRKKRSQLVFFFFCSLFFSPKGALKSYLRELPEPLMTTELYDEWIQASKWVVVFLLNVFSWIMPLATMEKKQSKVFYSEGLNCQNEKLVTFI